MAHDPTLETSLEDRKAYRKLHTRVQHREIMTLHFFGAKTAQQEDRLVWVTSGFPVEIPVSMGIYPVYPEQYGAIVGSEKVGPLVCGFAEELGFSQELCSYARCSIGAVQKPDQSPMYGLPTPQALLTCNNICGTVLRWYEAVSQMTGAPVYALDTPPLEDTQPSHHLAYVRSGLEDLITFLSEHFNRPYDGDQLEKTAQLSNEAVNLWVKILNACRSQPSPLNCADRFIAMAPIVSMRGTQEILNYYQALLHEVETRVKQGIGAIREERIRLLWDNIPPWPLIFKLYNGLAERGVVFPADTYTHAWSGGIERGDVLESIARTYSNIYLNKDLSAKIDIMCRLIKDFHLEGFVLFSVRSCKRYSLGQMIAKEQIIERTGVPGVIIEGDMVDSRLLNEVQIQTRIDAFLEMIL